MAFSNHKANIALFASVSLGLGGLILMVMGAYFAFLRPPLLPEYLQYMSSSSAQIQSAVPGLLPWLTHVFSVLAGFVFATGLLTVHVASTGLRAGRFRLAAIAAVAGGASIGWMAITNVSLNSDFKWLLLVFTFPWLVAVTLYSTIDLGGAFSDNR